MIIHGVGNILTGVLPFFKSAQTENLSKYAQLAESSLIKEIASASYIVSILLGVALIFLGLGLFHRRRAAWLWALILQFFIFINSCLPIFSLYGVIVSIVFFILLILSRKEFYLRNNQQQSVDASIAWISIVFSLSYGIFGSYLMRDQFHGIHNMIDAFYFTMVTYSTVGYGDIVPVTENAKMFTASMIIIGITSFVATLTLVIGPMIQQRVKGMYRIMSKLDNFSNHIVIAGFNDLTRVAASTLISQGSDVLFLEKDRLTADDIKAHGFNVITGDSTQTKHLESSNLSQATTLVCGHDSDAKNILTLIAAHEAKTLKQHHPEFTIICRIEEPHNIQKAKKIGADVIITPSLLAGQMITDAITQAK